jgi:hypothetical protein
MITNLEPILVNVKKDHVVIVVVAVVLLLVVHSGLGSYNNI